MKPLFTLFLLSVLLFSNKVNAQIHHVFVEKYYISDSLDATDTTNFTASMGTYPTPFLPIGSITYRVYVQLDSGYKVRKIYGTACHPLKVASTANFFNCVDRSAFFGYGVKKQYFSGTPMLPLDSWFTIGKCAVGSGINPPSYVGVYKPDDTDGSLIGGSHSSGFITNNDTAAHIPVDTADGMMISTEHFSNWVDNGFNNSGLPASGLDTTVFGDSLVGSKFYSTYAYLQENQGVAGEAASGHKVLVGQFTTTGELTFELNLEVWDSTGGTNNGHLLNFVASKGLCDTVGADTTVLGMLKYPMDAPVCGCGDPNFLEYNANAPCFNDSLCHNRIVFGCMDTLACNYDSHANYHIQYLCCYPGKCNDRNINLVCPGIISNSGFTLYPNPVSNVLNIDITIDGAQETKYSIYDAYGTEIRNNDFGTQSGTISQQIDVSDFQMGLYLIRVFHGAISESKTFMKN